MRCVWASRVGGCWETMMQSRWGIQQGKRWSLTLAAGCHHSAAQEGDVGTSPFFSLSPSRHEHGLSDPQSRMWMCKSPVGCSVLGPGMALCFNLRRSWPLFLQQILLFSYLQGWLDRPVTHAGAWGPTLAMACMWFNTLPSLSRNSW